MAKRGGVYIARDRGVHPNLLDRKFGEAGKTDGLTKEQAQISDYKQRVRAEKALETMRRNRPLKPPSKRQPEQG